MKQFQFRLRTVLQLRERERDQAADAYRQAQAAELKLEAQINELWEQHRGCAPSHSSGGLSVVNTQQIVESQRYQGFLVGQIEQIQGQLQLIQQESEKRRLRLVECEKDVRSVEKLKDRQREQWEAERVVHEQNTLDDWASFQHWRSNNE